MEINSVINIYNFEISTFGLFVFAGFVLAMFAFWQEGIKDGFREERLFDLFFLISFFTLFGGRIYYIFTSNLFTGENAFQAALLHLVKFWTPGIDIRGGFIGALIGIYIINKFLKWSLYRILDITSLAASLGAAIAMLGFITLQKRFEFLIAFGIYLLFYSFLSHLRNTRLKSGVIFSIFLTLNVALGMVFFTESIDLIFYGLLVTLSLFNLYFRTKKDFMSTHISKNLLEKLKAQLEKKEKRLEEEKQELQDSDPYLVADRDEGNADLEDEVQEDMEKEISDKKISSIDKMLTQIRKALGKIDEGTYGISEVSGKPIPEDRLKAYPEATTLVDESNE